MISNGELAIMIFVYIACGLLFYGCIGGPRSRFQWDGSPPMWIRGVVILFWPFILVLVLGGGR